MNPFKKIWTLFAELFIMTGEIYDEKMPWYMKVIVWFSLVSIMIPTIIMVLMMVRGEWLLCKVKGWKRRNKKIEV